ncbi:uncharacterized protein A1O9_10691 [Exophiala aquamarina CBS 119918]|uniref:Adenylate cyclase n=1 Tax=Exophiala aquamarina CBS 119918 TaxID=1182545 RepID=A0A072P1T8_9EURO|nr:uncharacterized protein A1O9_10691 [Exophiala aquamarina CBS 119918]KEF53243.1 hypothetical protein A1O9_10691 [Exophiala aquamarina CBS 119918]
MTEPNIQTQNGISQPDGQKPQAEVQIELPATQETQPHPSGPLVSSNGWDGKLRMQPRNAVLSNPEILSDPDYSDPDAPPVDQIEADEDLLEDMDVSTEDIDLVHSRIASLPALKLERFTKVQRLCLRQNQISSIQFPPSLGDTVQELDLYDNLISHIKGLDDFKVLTTLDLSFNKIKHIKHLNHLHTLKELFFVQNRISKIENLEGLDNLLMIELAANRLRELENLEPLRALQELWLGKNKITEIKNLTPLTNLRLLDIKSNRLTAISGLGSLTNLEELYVSHNAITEISPTSLSNNHKLRVLDISNNLITRLEHIGHLKHLEELWASSNKISDFREVERELADKEHLDTVYFEMNPLQLAGPALYRNKVRLALPQVSQIDASECSPSRRI